MLPMGTAGAAGFLQGVRSRAPKPLDYGVRAHAHERYDVDTDTYVRYTAEDLAEDLDVLSRNELAMIRNYGACVLEPTRLVEVPVDPPVPWWRRLLRWLRWGQKREGFVAPRVGDGWDECMEAIRAGRA